MPLFVCSECGCVDNTALTGYWVRVGIDRLPPLCSRCDPDREQHTRFPLVPWDGSRPVYDDGTGQPFPPDPG